MIIISVVCKSFLPLKQLPSQGPLKPEELIKFLKHVKASKKPQTIAQKFTQNIPGLVDQLRLMKNHPLLKKSLQQRILKLIKNLDV